MFGKNDAISAARAAEINIALLVERIRKLDTIETVLYRDEGFWGHAIKTGTTEKSAVGMYTSKNVDENNTITITFSKKHPLSCKFFGIK